MKPVHWLLLITGLFALVLWRVLQNPDPAPQSAGMKTLSKKPALAKASAIRARRAAQARARRAEDKADIAVALKRCADLDSGKTKAIPAEEVWRALGV